MAKPTKTRKKGGPESLKRRERRFSTSPTFMPLWVSGVGVVGSAILGAGVMGQWIIDPPLTYAAYVVAVGGLGLAIALWFGQPSEEAVVIGDSGIGVDGAGRGVVRIPWYQMRAVRVMGGYLVIEAATHQIKFLMGANRHAAAWALKQAAERVPDVVDVGREVLATLPAPGEVAGFLQDVENDQVAGSRCCVSEKVINLEEDARLCPTCGRIYHKDSLTESCACGAALAGHALRA